MIADPSCPPPRRGRGHFWPILICLLAAAAQAETIEVKIDVDAREIARSLLHARIELPVKAGELALWYAKWIPGIHGPQGPIQNMAGLRIVSAEGTPIAWQRDGAERYRLLCQIPKGVERIVISLDYICNQPSTNSIGVDSYGNPLLGLVNWNTCLLYPETHASTEVSVDLHLRLPDEWQWASALRELGTGADGVHFQRLSLRDLIDSPIIFGKHIGRYPLAVSDIPPVTLHVISESAAAVDVPDSLIDRFADIATEAGLLSGGGPFERYEWLLLLSDDLPHLGLEHLSSSLNGVGEEDFESVESLLGWEGDLLPHEFVHAWCGKYRRPAGMDTPNFHANKDTRNLWVYEGLTMHLGRLLTVRGGLWTLDHFTEVLALNISRYLHQTGRRWRSLEDTAVDNFHLRGGTPAWSSLRRGQAYYIEGLLFWLDVDTIIRTETSGERSLDDFCLQFLGAENFQVDVLPYETDDIIRVLAGLADYDWGQLIQERVIAPQEELPVDFVTRLGYRLEYGDEPSAEQKRIEADGKVALAPDSIGLSVKADGTVKSNVVPGMPADAAGLAPGMQIVGVNDRKFTLGRFREAIEASVTSGQIALLVLDGDLFATYVIDYDGGPRYLTLVRDPARPDLLARIYAPLRPVRTDSSETPQD